MLNSPIYRELPRKKQHKTLRNTVKAVIDEMEVGTRFSGLDLYELVIKRSPECTGCFLETILRYARMYKREKFICVNKYNSIYERVECNE